jgi:glycosyltransferase involved in cell wall biosynthesis
MASLDVRLCFLGPMVGRHPGYVTTQGLIVADLFAAHGYRVLLSSTSLNRYARLVDINQTLLRHRREIDVVVADVYGGASFVVEDLLSLNARMMGLPLIFVIHGGTVPEFARQHPAWVRRVLSRADVLVAPSAFIIEGLADQGFAVRHIANVVDLSAYEFIRREQVRPCLFWMRSFHEIYNPEMAVRVLARLRESHPDARLIMAGSDKGRQAAVEALAAELGVRASIEFPGFLKNEQKVAFGRKADIFINTSRIDNMPVALLEAGALGMPIVTTNVGGIPYLVSHETSALMVGDDDVEGMVAAIERLLASPELVGRLTGNGRRMAERSNWDVVRPQWEALFAEVTARRQGLNG